MKVGYNTNKNRLSIDHYLDSPYEISESKQLQYVGMKSKKSPNQF